MWAWFRQGMLLRHKLRPAYFALLSWPQVVGLLLILPFAKFVIEAAFLAVGVPWNAPVHSSERFPLALGLMFLLLFLFIVVGCALGLFFVALGLRYFAGWSWQRVWALFVRYEMPDHWLLHPEGRHG